MGRSRSHAGNSPLDADRRALVVGSAAAATAMLIAGLARMPAIDWPMPLPAPASRARAGRRKVFQAVPVGEGFVANGRGARDAVHYVTRGHHVRGATSLDPSRLAPLRLDGDLVRLVRRLPRKLAPAAVERAALERIGDRAVAEALVLTAVMLDLARPFAGERPSYRLYDLAATLALARDRANEGAALDALIMTVDGSADAGLRARVANWRDAAGAWHRRRSEALARGATRWSITDFDGRTRLDFAIRPAV